MNIFYALNGNINGGFVARSQISNVPFFREKRLRLTKTLEQNWLLKCGYVVCPFSTMYFVLCLVDKVIRPKYYKHLKKVPTKAIWADKKWVGFWQITYFAKLKYVQRVLALREFHYCGFSKKSINLPYASLCLMLGLFHFISAIFLSIFAHFC